MANSRLLCERVEAPAVFPVITACCTYCDSEFSYQKQGRGRPRKFCSVLCRTKHFNRVPRTGGRGIVSVQCEMCKRAFSYQKRHNGQLRRFCSGRCKDRHFDPNRASTRNRWIRSKQQKQCKACGIPFDPVHALSMYCSTQCRSRVRKWYNFVCVVCGAGFRSQAHKASCCGPECVKRYQSRITLELTREQREATQAKRHRTCEQCWKEFTAAEPNGKQLRGEITWGKYCSKRCSAEARRIWASPAEANRQSYLRTHPRREVTCPACGKVFQIERGQRFCSNSCRQVMAVPAAPPPRPCHECGVIFTPGRTSGGRRIFCSAPCARRAARRVAKALDRARRKAIRSVTVERVRPFAVFERDGWRCRICGVMTPRSLRGTYDPCAPELDHIVPLAAGGEHSYRNTHCACRDCNGKKGDGGHGKRKLSAAGPLSECAACQ